jgi:flagellar motor switch protein FliN/FliY
MSDQSDATPGPPPKPTSAPPQATSPEPSADASGSDGPRTTDDGLPGLDLVLDVPLQVTVEIGSARMLVQEVLQLDSGSVIELDRMAGEPADMLVNGRVFARGEVIVSDDRLSIRLVEITGGSPLGSANR